MAISLALRPDRSLENLKVCVQGPQQATFLCCESVRPALSAFAARLLLGQAVSDVYDAFYLISYRLTNCFMIEFE